MDLRKAGERPGANALEERAEALGVKRGASKRTHAVLGLPPPVADEVPSPLADSAGSATNVPLRPIVDALAELLVADLLRVRPERR